MSESLLDTPSDTQASPEKHEESPAPKDFLISFTITQEQTGLAAREIIDGQEDNAYELVPNEDEGEAFVSWMEELSDNQLGAFILGNPDLKESLERLLSKGVKDNFLDESADVFLDGDDTEVLSKNIHKHLLTEAENAGVLKSANAQWRLSESITTHEAAMAQARRLANESINLGNHELARELLAAIVRHGSEDEASEAQAELDRLAQEKIIQGVLKDFNAGVPFNTPDRVAGEHRVSPKPKEKTPPSGIATAFAVLGVILLGLVLILMALKSS